jgi:NTP pyrophosphatase (non-canonical NTP hydrolase)
MNRNRVFELVSDERDRQEELKRQGRFMSTCADNSLWDAEKLAVLMEEVGELSRAVLETLNLCADKHGSNTKDELVQIAAVCCAWLESLEDD